MGLRRYRITAGTNPTTTSLAVTTNSIENNCYRVVVDTATGFITSITDKLQGREMIDAADTHKFNGIVTATNIEYFWGITNKVSVTSAPTVSTGLNGPVAASLKISHPNHPTASLALRYGPRDPLRLRNRPAPRRPIRRPAPGGTLPANTQGFFVVDNSGVVITSISSTTNPTSSSSSSPSTTAWTPTPSSRRPWKACCGSASTPPRSPPSSI